MHCLYVCFASHAPLVFVRPEGGIRAPGLELHNCEMPCRCWKSNAGPPEEQFMQTQNPASKYYKFFHILVINNILRIRKWSVTFPSGTAIILKSLHHLTTFLIYCYMKGSFKSWDVWSSVAECVLRSWTGHRIQSQALTEMEGGRDGGSNSQRKFHLMKVSVKWRLQTPITEIEFSLFLNFSTIQYQGFAAVIRILK